MNTKLWKILVPVALIVAISPVVALAAQFHAQDQVRLQDEELIEENIYAAGGDVVLDTPVDGDVFLAGGQIRIDSSVSEDLFVAGGEVRIDGPVEGDLRVAGGTVRISSSIGGDLLVAGGDVELMEGASVAGQTNAGAGRLVIAGTTQSIEAGVEELRVESSARIQGSLNYTSENEARIAEGAVIDGEVTRRQVPVERQDARRGMLFFFTSAGIIWLVASLIIALLFVLALPAKSVALVRSWRSDFLMNLLWGLLILIVTPIAAFMLMISIVGLPLGLLLLVAYLLFIFIAKLVTVFAFGSWVVSLVGKKEAPLWAGVVFGMLLLIIVSAVPVIGPLVLFLAFLSALGALARYDVALYRRLRERGDF